MKKYKFIDHTADVMFEVKAKTLKEIFENAALAVFEVQVELNSVKRKIKKEIKLKNANPEDLLFDFLEELIYIKDAKYLVFNKFKVKLLEKASSKTDKKEFLLKCTAEGEKIDPKKHELKTDVKAITLHEFYLRKIGKTWKCRVLLDI